MKKESTPRNVDMNYPPKDLSQKELERFWGEPDRTGKWAREMRRKKVKPYEPSPV
jgi:hypothetical protein